MASLMRQHVITHFSSKEVCVEVSSEMTLFLDLKDPSLRCRATAYLHSSPELTTLSVPVMDLHMANVFQLCDSVFSLP